MIYKRIGDIDQAMKSYNQAIQSLKKDDLIGIS